MSPELSSHLSAEIARRPDPEVVEPALARLGNSPPPSFVEFYRQFEGPFTSTFAGSDLLDLPGDPKDDLGSVEGVTQACREHHGFDPKYLVLSSFDDDGGGFIYDWVKDWVHAFDFEGKFQEMLDGKLEPDWRSFDSFLDSFFLNSDGSWNSWEPGFILPDLWEVLDGKNCRRVDPKVANETLARLGIEPKGLFVDFYEKYLGPFISERTSHVLLDLASGDPSVESKTIFCRKRHGLDRRYLALTQEPHERILIYDSMMGSVYLVSSVADFRRLRDHKLPSIGNFTEILHRFFLASEKPI